MITSNEYVLIIILNTRRSRTTTKNDNNVYAYEHVS